LALALALALPAVAQAAGGFATGNPDIKMAGPLTFGPDGVLFVGDPQSAAVFAIETKDNQRAAAAKPVNVDDIGNKVAALLGTMAADITINDLAVNPTSGRVYLSVSRGQGSAAQPVIVTVDGDGKLAVLSTENVSFAKADLPNAPAAPAPGAQRDRRAPNRAESITDLQFVDNQLIVAGISNEEFASKLRTIPYPFQTVGAGMSIEIWHASHNALETRSPVRTFTTYNIGSTPHLLAAYTCTPLVKVPLAKLSATEKVMGDTVAELGNGNQPLDMFVYKKGGKDYVLMANSRRGVMKVDLSTIGTIEPLKERVAGTGGLPFETIASAQGVVQLDQLNANQAVTLVNNNGSLKISTMDLP
jgi:hypothetical protein